MAAPTYATDLTDILLDMPNTTGWTALGGGAGGLVAPETDFFIQGSNCISKAGWSTATKGMIFNSGAGITVPTDGAVLMWIYYWAPNSLDTEANGGLQLLIGSATTAFKQWYVAGSNTLPFGGWVIAAVNPTITQDNTTGSPSATLQYFGSRAAIPAGGPSKGQPLGIDAFRYGRCELSSIDGDGTFGFATFDGAAVYAGDVIRRWGLLDQRDGAYYLQGLFIMGLAATAVDFRDSNRVIFIRDTKKVTSNFNTIEVRNASSNIIWTNISIQALGTVSSGRWITTDNAVISLDGCTFTDMGAFQFDSNFTAVTTTWRRCGQITAGSSAAPSITDSLITGYTGSADTSAMVWNHSGSPNGKLDGTTFVKGATDTHAIEFGTSSPIAMTLTNVIFSGYSASDGQNHSALHIKRTSGVVDITISGGTVPSFKSDGATVNIIAGAVDVTITVKDTSVPPVAIESARVFIQVDSGGSLPFEASVTISNSGTIATVTHTGHGLSINDKILIDGASHWQNNGVFSITGTGANEYTYTLPSDPGSSPTGTIIATFVVLEGLTDGTGVITMSRVFSAQPIIGRVRKAGSSPFYKTANLVGEINSSEGFSATVQLLSDE